MKSSIKLFLVPKSLTEPMIAMFTHSNPDSGLQSQSIAYSNDKGRTWTKYQGNPVIGNPGIPDFRDPKVQPNHLFAEPNRN